MKAFQLTNEYQVICRAENTRYGFRHLAELTHDGYIVAKAKTCYYNRTWEAFEFQTVLHKVINSYFNSSTAQGYRDITDSKAHTDIDASFKAIGLLATMGNALCESQEDKNKWKQRMLAARLPELDFTTDFGQLTEAEKEQRLDKVIKQLT